MNGVMKYTPLGAIGSVLFPNPPKPPAPPLMPDPNDPNILNQQRQKYAQQAGTSGRQATILSATPDYSSSKMG